MTLVRMRIPPFEVCLQRPDVDRVLTQVHTYGIVLGRFSFRRQEFDAAAMSDTAMSDIEKPSHEDISVDFQKSALRAIIEAETPDVDESRAETSVGR